MAKDTQSLRVNVTGDASKLTKELDGVAGRMDKLGKGMQSTGKTMTKWVTGPIAGAAAGMAGLAVSAANTGDELATTSDKIGVNTDMLQDLEYWASQNGVAQNQMEKAVGRLNQRIGMASQGNEKYKSALEGLNVELRDNQGNVRDTDEVLAETLTTLSNMEDSSEQVGLATELFGTKLTRDLLPALQEGSLSLDDAREAMDKHGRMTEEQIDKASKFSAQWDDLKRAGQSLALELGAELIPIFSDTLMPLLEDRLVPAARAGARSLGRLVEAFNDLPGPVQAAIGGFTGLAAAAGPVLWTTGQIIQELPKLATGFRSTTDAAKALNTRLGGLRGTMKAGIGVAFVLQDLNAAKQAMDEFGDTIETVDGKIQHTAESQEEWQGMWPELRENIADIFQPLEAGAQLMEILEEKWSGANAEFESTGEILPSVTRFVQDLENPLDNTGGLLAEIGISSDAAAGGLGDMGDEAGELSEAAKQLKDDLDRLNGSTISVERAAIAWGNQIGSLDEQLKETSGTLDMHTEEGRANRGMLLDTAEAAKNHVQAMIEDGASTEQATRALQTHVGELRQQAIEGGVAEEQIDSYISTLNLTPEHIKTLVEAETAEAEAKVRSLRGWLDQLSGTTRTAVELVTHGFGGPAFGGSLPTGHAGGRVESLPSTSGLPSGDERLVKAQTGERLLNRGETRAFEQLHGGEMVRVLKRIEAKLDRGGGDGMQVVIQNPQREPAEDSLARANRNSAYLAGK